LEKIKEVVLLKRTKKIILLITAFSLCFQSFAYADTKSNKDETVYVNLESDGKIKNTIIVNAFKVNGQNKVIDYGKYENIKNLSGTQKPSVNNGYIEFDVDPGIDTFYYQGEVHNTELPWNFTIKYYLDGVEMKGEELIGKSGNAVIEIDAQSNKNADPYFSNNYLAQLSMTLDSDIFKNVSCSDAMITTIGNNKQVSLMILPGTNKTYHISANVSEFEMDGMTIAMVRVSDGISETLDSLKISMGDLSSGIDQLISGSGQLKGGTQDLTSAISLLNTGVSSIARSAPALTAGMSEIDKGAWSVYDGSKKLSAASALIRGGLGELDSKSIQLISGIDAISGGLSEMTKSKTAVKEGINELNKSKSGVNELAGGVNTLSDGYKNVETKLSEVASKKDAINDGINTLKSADTDISELTGGLDTLQSGVSELSYANSQQRQIIDALAAAAQKDPNLAPYAQYIGTMQYISKNMGEGFSSASTGIDALKDGVNTAQDGINTLYASANTFAESASALTDAAGQLHDGMKELNEGFDKLRGNIGKVNKLFNAANSFADSSLKLAEGAEKISDGVSALKSGTEEYTAGVNKLAVNYIDLDNGIYELESGASALSGGVTELYSGSDSLVSAINEVSDNMNKLDSSASGLPDSIDLLRMGGHQIIEGLGSSSGGDMSKLITMSSEAIPVSFAAPGIITPKTVQFAIKTPNLHLPDDEADEEEPEKAGFFQKLVNLFKKD